jgi:hypothetical protein
VVVVGGVVVVGEATIAKKVQQGQISDTVGGFYSTSETETIQSYQIQYQKVWSNGSSDA